MSIIQSVHTVAPVNYVLSPFEGNINPGGLQGIKLYIQGIKRIDNEAYKLDISVSNAKDVIDHVIGLANKYGRGLLAFMVDTGAGSNNSFGQVDQIQISDMHHQAHEYV